MNAQQRYRRTDYLHTTYATYVGYQAVEFDLETGELVTGHYMQTGLYAPELRKVFKAIGNKSVQIVPDATVGKRMRYQQEKFGKVSRSSPKITF